MQAFETKQQRLGGPGRDRPVLGRREPREAGDRRHQVRRLPEVLVGRRRLTVAGHLALLDLHASHKKLFRRVVMMPTCGLEIFSNLWP